MSELKNQELPLRWFAVMKLIALVLLAVSQVFAAYTVYESHQARIETEKIIYGH